MTVTSTTPLQITIRPPALDNDGQAAQANSSPNNFWSDDAPGFKDVLDTINPLQHIPIVSTIYQSLTGDVQSTGAKLAGGALFGGPLGFFTSLFDSIIQSATGSDIGGNIMAAIEGKPVPAMHTADTQTAQNSESGFLSPNQRAAYNAYVRTSMLA